MNRLTLRWPAVVILSAMILSFFAIGALPASAQATTSGIIVGEVKDPTHAFVPGAVITAIDPTINIKYSTVSDSDGKYVLPDVPPGSYTVTAVKAGFATDRIDGLAITVGSQTTANFNMAVGAETTTIEVQATNADLQTMNATIGDTVTQEQIDALPSINRDVSSFAALQPGVTPNGFVAGTNADQAVFMLDGGNNSNDMDGSSAIYTGSFATTSGAVNSTSYTSVTAGASSSGVMPMPQDSMEEFRVATTGQTADFNNSSGFQAQTVTKRGHNDWHGTVYEYYLDSHFGANTWANNLSNTAKPSYHYNRFGAAGGGPLISKNILGGKTYIFGNYEGFRYPLAAVYERVVPSLAFEQGNITLNEATTPTPYTAAQVKAADPRGIGLNPTVAAYWLKYEPQQGTTYAGGGHFDPSSNGCGTLSSSTTCDGANTLGFISTIKTPQTSNFFVVRMDHDFGSKWHLMASYRNYKLANLTSNQVDIGGYFSGDTVGQAVATDPRPQTPWYFVTGLTTNISSSLTNNFHYSYLRNYWSWNDSGAPAPAGLGAALEPGGESATAALAPITENNQNIRTRTWDGHDHFFADDLAKLKGNHLFQFGGQYQHDFAYHSRTDNGGTVNYYPVYQLGETANSGLVTLPGLQAGGLSGANTTGANERLLAMNLGIVTDSQVVYTRSGSALTLNPPLTPAFDQTTVPFYNVYFSDTWHVKPSLTINYGVGYSIEMPASEKNGKQVALVDGGDNPIVATKYLAARAAAASQGQVYNPELGFAMVGNTANGGTKYPYSPYYGQVSPRLSLAWNPKFKSEGVNKFFGDGATVVRGGYGRTYGRLNGVGLVLVPLLGPGLIQSVDCQNPLGNGSSAPGTCGAASTDTTNFRIGVDGGAAPLPTVSTNLPQPFYPGYNGSQTSSSQTIDPTLRPSAVDTFNLSFQRQVTRKTLVEVGYIGRIIKHSYEGLGLNTVPYMMSVGGQTFESAYVALEQAYGCTTSIGLCLHNTAAAAHPTVPAQQFFETALGGPTSAYCSPYANCTTAVVAHENSNIGTQKVYQLFSDLDNGPFNFPGYSRIMEQTPIPSSQGCGAFCATGQLGAGPELVTSTGYGNYNAMFITFRATNWHGLTAQENFTYGKALGLYDQAQSTSDQVPNDAFDLKKSYGVQSYNQKFIFNTFLVWQTPWYKSQSGIIGRLAGGWTIAPVFTAGSGQPRYGSDNGSSNEAFGGGNGTFADNEQLVFTTPYKGGYHTNRGATGGLDAYGNKVGTSTAGPSGTATAVNVFSNPVAVWNTVRPPILGLDEHDGGAGPIQGLPYWGLDLSIQKTVKVWEKTSLTLYGVSTNVLNHLVFSNGSMTLSSGSNWGEVTGQQNNPRQIQMGVRVSY